MLEALRGLHTFFSLSSNASHLTYPWPFLLPACDIPHHHLPQKAGGVGTVARFLGGGDAQASLPNNVVSVVLATLCDACKDHERNRDAFIYTNMAQVNVCLVSFWSGEVVVGFRATPDLQYFVSADGVQCSTQSRAVHKPRGLCHWIQCTIQSREHAPSGSRKIIGCCRVLLTSRRLALRWYFARYDLFSRCLFALH